LLLNTVELVMAQPYAYPNGIYLVETRVFCKNVTLDAAGDERDVKRTRRGKGAITPA
jgi:hypothetical protein